MDYKSSTYEENKVALIERMKFYGSSDKLIQDLEQTLSSMKYPGGYIAALLDKFSMASYAHDKCIASKEFKDEF